jgi:glycosyltransferase involved in cell wall biosynthesis
MNYQLDCTPCPEVRNPWNPLISSSFKSQRDAIKKLKRISFVTPSNWLAKISENSAIGRGISVSVIHNPIPANYFAHQPVRKVSGILKIGFISANLDNPYKGLDVLISALDILSSGPREQYSLKLIGHGKIPEAVNKKRITQVVANSDQEVISELIDLDVLVVPSTEDNSPSVIGEALALGVRVIGSNVGGIPEILQKFGMLMFESKDSRSLAAHLSNLSDSFDPSSIRSLAKEQFGEEKIAKLYFDLYASLI